MTGDQSDFARSLGELLRAAGVNGLHGLAASDSSDLAERLDRVNTRTHRMSATPSPQQLEQLIAAARDLEPRANLPHASRAHYDLLHTAGVSTYVELARAEPGHLHLRLNEVNRQVRVAPGVPPAPTISLWVSHAQDLTRDFERHGSDAELLGALPGEKRGPII